MDKLDLIRGTDPEPQKALVSFYNDKKAAFVYVSGRSLKCDIDEGGLYDPDDLGFLDTRSPDHGLWVWEGTVTFHGRDHNGEYDDPTYEGTWRKPTANEWAAIKKNMNPFEVWATPAWVGPAAAVARVGKRGSA